MKPMRAKSARARSRIGGARASYLIVALICGYAAGCTTTAGIGSLPDLGDAGAVSDGVPVGDGQQTDGSSDDQGPSGTGTLKVEAQIGATATGADPKPAQAAKVEYSVHLDKDGSDLSGATVTMRNAGGTVTLLDQGSGDYRASATGYHVRNTLTVVSGSDRLDNVTLEGPVAHRITSPTVKQLHLADTPLTIRWSATGAQRVEVKTKDDSFRGTSDTGSYLVDAKHLSGDAGKETNDKAEVHRKNTMEIKTGAKLGSSFEIEFRNSVDFIIDGKNKS